MSIIEINAISRKISDTEEQLKRLPQTPENVYASIVRDQLEKRLRVLNGELEKLIASQNVDSISLRIFGASVNKGKISNRVLVSMLNGFQSLADSVASAIISPASRGKIPQYVKELTDFQVVGVFDGSFGVQLERAQPEAELQASSSPAGSILNEIFLIMETSTNDEKLVEEIAPLGSRTINKYLEWMSGIKEHDVSLEVNWTDRAAEVRRLCVTPEMTRDIIDTLENINDMVQTDVTIKGRLTGINIRQASFEILTDDGKIIKGKGILETLIEASKKLGDEVTASLVKSTYNSRANIHKVSWYLSGLA